MSILNSENTGNFKSALLALLILISFIFSQSSASASPLLMGGASAAGETSFNGILANPAMAVDFDAHIMSLTLVPNYKTQQIRYPGFPSNDSSGLGGFTSIPVGGGVYRINSKLAVGMTLPIPGLSAKINFEDLPLNILGQQANVDIKADGQLFKFEGFAAMKLNSMIRLGILAGFESTSADVTIIDSDTKDEVVPVTLNQQKYRVRIGASFKVHPKVDVGFGSTVYQRESTEFKAEFLSDIQADQKEEGAPKIDRFFVQTIAGVGVQVTPKISVMGEVEYNPAPTEKRLSLVDFTEQPIDGTASVGGRAGLKFQLNSQLAVMAGGAYEPTTVGPGTQGTGAGDTTGYGFFDFNLAGVLGQPVKPFWLAGGGVEYKFNRISTAVPRKVKGRVRPRRASNPPRYRAGVMAGVAYQQSSVGIDNSGEQPAAYLQTLWHIPLTFYWNFY